MKTASEKQQHEIHTYFKTNPIASPELECAKHLHRVAETFILAQQLRHIADYDNYKTWTLTEVLNFIDRVDAAFRSWHEIRDEEAAQDFLLSLLGSPKGN